MKNLLCFGFLRRRQCSKLEVPAKDASRKDQDCQPRARTLGLADILILDSPTVPLQPTSKSKLKLKKKHKSHVPRALHSITALCRTDAS
ncbi:hypothetical protein TKK_0015196 [Trichogramma kaykai]